MAFLKCVDYQANLTGACRQDHSILLPDDAEIPLTRVRPPWPSARDHDIEPTMNRVDGQASNTFMPLGEALAHAERCRSDGRLMEAEAVCRRVLEAQPNLPEASHVLGLI